MPSDRKPSLILPVAVAALLLLSAYVGTYYATVQPGEASHGLVIPLYRVYSDAGYDESRLWERIFDPIHQLDRRVRPGVWRGPL